jgi:hypothetical protein
MPRAIASRYMDRFRDKFQLALMEPITTGTPPTRQHSNVHYRLLLRPLREFPHRHLHVNCIFSVLNQKV